MKTKLVYFLFAALILSSCDTTKEENPPAPTPSGSAYILVGNEGAFGGESASLSVIDTVEGTIVQNAYAAANDEAQLGDVLQSMSERNGEIYLVVNNSGKIEVVDAGSLSSKRTITGFSSPRYLCFASDDKGYVSNLFANSIDIINPQNGTFLNSVPTSNYIEKMKIHNGEMWCTAPGSDKLYFLNLATDQISDSLTLSAGVSEIGMDVNSDFWVLAQGTYSEPIVEPAIYHIDGSTKSVIDSFSFPDGTGYGGTLEMSGDGQSVLYIIGGDLYKMAITTTSLPASPFISNPSVSYYALNVNPENGDIALTNAANFSQTGNVYFYTASGEMIDEYEAGIVPHSVLWVTE